MTNNKKSEDSVEYWQEREEAENQDMMDRIEESQLDDFISNYGVEDSI